MTDTTWLDVVLDDCIGRVMTYEQLFRREHHNPLRFDEDKNHAKHIAKATILTKLKEARIDEWTKVLDAEINHSGSPAPFNPDGLPISTPATQEMTRLLREYSQQRINELNQEATQ